MHSKPKSHNHSSLSTFSMTKMSMLRACTSLASLKYFASLTLSAASKVGCCVGTVMFNIALSTQSIVPKVQSAQSKTQELYSNLYNKHSHTRHSEKHWHRQICPSPKHSQTQKYITPRGRLSFPSLHIDCLIWNYGIFMHCYCLGLFKMHQWLYRN